MLVAPSIAMFLPGQHLPAPYVLFVLCMVLAASTTVYWILVKRSTDGRQWVALTEWAREHGYRLLRRAPADSPEAAKPLAPAPFDVLPTLNPQRVVALANKQTTLLRLETNKPGDPSGETRSEWNVLIRQIESAWLPSGLRPAEAKASVLDLFSLSSFPVLGTGERFVVYGSDPAMARILATSAAQALLPPDIGLLLHGRRLVLDFSSRPFDDLEFGRMIALAESLLAHLPAPK